MPSLQTNTLDQTFTYDGVDRLIWANIGGSPTYGYEYDATGNRTLTTITGNPYLHTVSPSSNKLTSVQIAGEGNTPLTQAISYDPAGNTTQTTSGSPSTSPLSLSYSARGRLSAAQIPNPQNVNTPYTVNYLTNGLEQRVFKSGPTTLIPTGSTSYFYDEAGHLLGEYDGNQIPVYETVYLNESPVAIIKQNRTPNPNTQPQTYTVTTEIFNIYADHIDTPRVITKASDQSIVWSWMAAEPFGATQPNQNPHNLGTFTFNQRFPGQVFDSESNLSQNWHREFQGLRGRYLQSDPIGLAGGMNTYSYALNQPILLTDRLGLDTEMCTRRFWPGVVMPYARHCFIRFNGNPNDTLGFDNSQVGPDAAPTSMGTCEKTKGEENDDCVRREMKKCDPQTYDFAKFNCCHCAQAALEACGLTAPNWPNWPINPAPPNTPRPEPKPKKP